jgi:IclR family acetate operon transcriptional repressor
VVRKALDVLEHLGLKGDAGVSHLSRELRLPLATVHRLLGTLCSAGYVLQNPSTQDYRLSTKVLDLSASVLSQLNVRTCALPFMRQLAANWRETVNLGVLEGNRIVYAESIPSPERLRFEPDLGDTFAPHCSALAKAICAHVSRAELLKILPAGRLTRFTAKTITDRRALLRQLEEARARGYALDDEERYQGIRAVAAPISNRHGKVAAAVNLVAPTVRMPDERMRDAATAVAKTAAEISRQLGFRPGASPPVRPVRPQPGSATSP